MRVSVTAGSFPNVEVLMLPVKGTSVAFITVGRVSNKESALEIIFWLVFESTRTSELFDTLILYATRSGVSASQLMVTGMAPRSVAPSRNAISVGLLLEKKCTTWSPKPILCWRRILPHCVRKLYSMSPQIQYDTCTCTKYDLLLTVCAATQRSFRENFCTCNFLSLSIA